ncbi:glycosyltransferase family 9 protein [Pseudonocardia sp.]|uniref:glycosyltransferase family 9 protein n=1 Tax=Pseudonocardia sp. TaxID=60912 RepID=UPI00262B6A7D|nr:glycosyltransferase family 9 protein [Pseudonocardia sp.]
MAERFRDILVVDLLGGIGDLCMVLPAVHALHRAHPGAALRVLTHAPGADLLRSDRAVTEVRRAERHRERAAVVAELDRCPPDLVVSTTRFDGIAEEIEARGMRSVTDMWRRPPDDEPVARRYVAILAAEGLVEGGYRPPSIHLTAAEQAVADRTLSGVAPSGAPVVLVPGAGMAVKRWPHWPRLASALARSGEPPLVVAGGGSAPGWGGAPVRPLPPTDLRSLAALFAAVGRRGGVVVGPDTGPVRVAAAVGARTVGLFGPTLAARYGLDPPALDLQGLPGCTHRRPTAITEQVCWWQAACPLSTAGPACMADIEPGAVHAALARVVGRGGPPTDAVEVRASG